ncbi:MAG: type II toxin-antitoxin system RelE/ParE family toxin [Gammaproteobacteria bacterium]
MTETLDIRIAPQALAQIEEAAEWWEHNRPSAPNAIAEDVREILTLLSTQPGVGTPMRRRRVKGLRRVVLTRVRYYVYYRVAGHVLEVLAFWHTSRGQSPRIRSQ